MCNTHQMSVWSGRFGREYTDRNSFNIDEFEDRYIKNYGVSRTDLNGQFLGDMDRRAPVLEVGANVGIQLDLLQRLGFEALYGIELQAYAVEKSREFTTGINIIRGSAFDIPFKAGFFSLVFTSGVLIHIHPDDLHKVMMEIYRCSRRYIWGFEYYCEDIEEIDYRSHRNLLWKADHAELFMQMFPSLRLIRKESINYTGNGNRDCMYLLEKAE